MLGVCLFTSCIENSNRQRERKRSDSLRVMELLQGIWIDDNTGLPTLKIKEDSLFLASQSQTAYRFGISDDTLVTYGADQIEYQIDSIDSHVFHFYTQVGDLMSLHKADNDTIAFGYQQDEEKQDTIREVVEKDSVFVYQGVRYRGYVFINPSTKKVIRPMMTEEGMIVDNIYYDNIIHICVYQGKEELYAQNISKEMFAGIFPDAFLQTVILSDMDFVGIDSDGYHYRASLCVPDDISCYYIDLNISYDGKLTCSLH